MGVRRWQSVLLGALVICIFGVAVGVSGAAPGDAHNETADISTQETDQVAIATELQNESGDVQVFVEFEGSADAASVAELQTAASESQADFRQFAERTEGVTLDSEFWITNGVTATVDLETVSVESLAAIEGVTRIQPPVTVEVDAVETQSTDVYSSSAPGTPVASAVGSASVATTQSETTYGLDQIGAPGAWETYDTQGEGVRVAVLDTGVDAEHPDITLTADGWAEFDQEGEKVDSEPNDGHGHGTHVSGTVAGGDASGKHIGVAPGVELLHGKVLDDGGSGSLDQIFAGMEWAVEQDVDVLSLSLGAPGTLDSFIQPVRNAEQAGVTVVASTGNDGEGTSSSPGNIPDAINVGATAENEEVASFSGGEEIETEEAWNDPPPEWPESYVVPTVVAPGAEVWSADPDNDHIVREGTSMAAPHVAGAVALMQAATGEEFSNDELEAALVETAWKPDSWEVPDDEPDVRYGYGIADVPAAVASLEAASEFAVTQAALSEETVLEGESVEITATVDNSGDETRNFTAALTVDGDWVEATTVAVEPDDSETVAFERAFATSGEYEIAVGDTSAGTLAVEKPATFELHSATVEPETILEGESAEISATVENVGDREGTFTGEFKSDGETVETRDVTLSGGESETVTFERAFADAGEYELAVNEKPAGTLKVEQPATLVVQNVTISPTPVVANESMNVTATVANEGDRAGNLTVPFAVDSESVANQSVQLDAYTTTEVVFEHTFAVGGEYDVAVGEYVKPVTVEAADTNEVPQDLSEDVTSEQYTVFLPEESNTTLATLRENIDDWVDDREIEGVDFVLAELRLLIEWWVDNR